MAICKAVKTNLTRKEIPSPDKSRLGMTKGKASLRSPEKQVAIHKRESQGDKRKGIATGLRPRNDTTSLRHLT